MKTLPMYCGSCKALIRVPLPEASTAYACDYCGAEIEAHVFPALLKNPAYGRSAEELLDPDDAGCYYHPTKKAEVHCESCGRFLCALCHVEFEKWSMCPQCIEQGVRTGRLGFLRTSSARYQQILLYSILPFFGPYALYLAYRHRNEQYDLMLEGKSSLAAAVALAVIQIALIMLVGGIWLASALGVIS